MSNRRKPANGEPERPERSIKLETWTWQDAEQALMKMKINRRVRWPEVDKYAREMLSADKEGRPMWGIDAHPVVIDWDGYMIDGQHRCLAQVKTQTTQEWLVYRNVPPETQRHINTGIGRSAADQLRFKEHPNSVVLGSVARWAFLLENGLATTGRVVVSPDEIVDTVERYPDLHHSVTRALQTRNGFVELTPTPLGAAHWWIAQHNDHAEADMFLDRFVNMNQEGAGSPILALMKRFIDVRRNRVYVPARTQIALIVKTWNYDVQGKYISKINLYSKSGEIKLQDVLKREISQSYGVETPLEQTDSSDDEDEAS